MLEPVAVITAEHSARMMLASPTVTAATFTA